MRIEFGRTHVLEAVQHATDALKMAPGGRDLSTEQQLANALNEALKLSRSPRDQISRDQWDRFIRALEPLRRS